MSVRQPFPPPLHSAAHYTREAPPCGSTRGAAEPCGVGGRQKSAQYQYGTFCQIRTTSHVGVVNANGLSICGNRLVELALRSQRIAEVGMGRSEVGLDPDRAPICRDRLVELALAHQRVAEPKMALGKIRLHC